MKGIDVSTGSACSSKKLEPSHVLLALRPAGRTGARLPPRHELSLQYEEEIDYLVEVLPDIVENLRKMSPPTGGQ